MGNEDLGIKVEAPEAETIIVPTHKWHYFGCHRTSGQDWFFGASKSSPEDAAKDLALYTGTNTRYYETKIIRIKMPI